MKKVFRLLDEIYLVIILGGILSFGVIWITPILIEHFFKAQELQRMGTSSSEENCLTLLCLVFLIVLACALYWCIRQIAWRISQRDSWTLNRSRCTYSELFEEYPNKRVLQKILFEEIKDGIPIPEEEELWRTLSEMPEKELREAIKQRKELIDEMQREGIVADINTD
ncbi:MAG: hypothetical protein HFJ19_03740 [Clostridia bacterium]|nr:hypothetical protein [Clostridia bacterium]